MSPRHQGTPLHKHRKRRSLLVPPLADHENLEPRVWAHDDLPEHLWLVLLCSHLHPDHCYIALRRIVEYWRLVPNDVPASGLTHTGLAGIDPSRLRDFVAFLALDSTIRFLLSPLAMFRDLPGRASWEPIFGGGDYHEQSTLLVAGIRSCLDRRSDGATDCQWAARMPLVLTGKYSMDAFMFDLWAHYPDKAEAMTRSMVRGVCLASPGDAASEWPSSFWEYCYAASPCLLHGEGPEDATSRRGVEDLGEPTSANEADAVAASVANHFRATIQTTKTDARHECAFGLALYSMATLMEVAALPPRSYVASGALLRAMVETHISLAYLAIKDDAALWQDYRSHGTGQAKLAYLKQDRIEEPSSAYAGEHLERLANADGWDEFQTIKLGTWGELNLRQMSIESNTKELYDQLYDWTSSVVHGSWGAVRDAVFDDCLNPLHRFHLLPRLTRKESPAVLGDAIRVANMTLCLLDGLYPGLPDRLVPINPDGGAS